MNNNLDIMLSSLDDEIEKKCFEQKQKNTEKALKHVFMLACAAFILIPFLLVFAGVNLFTLFLPALLFIAISFGALSPLLLNNNLGGLSQ